MKFKYQQFKRTIFAALFLIMSATFSFNANAQKVSDFIFEKYSIQNGLSQSSPLSLYQDKLGYIWVGTQAGVDRFDGYNFKQYSHDIKNEFSRSSGFVFAITEDKKGNIWTADFGSHISYLNRSNDHWENISILIGDTLIKSNKRIPGNFTKGISIYVDDIKNALWIGTTGTGILNYDIASKKFTQYLVHPENSIKFGNQEIVNKLLPLNDSKLLVSTDKGIQYFDIQNHTFTKIFNNNDSMFVTQPNDIKRNGDNIYVATNYGVYIYNISTKQITTFKNVQNNSNTIASNLIKDIHFSKSSNYLWLNVINKGIDIINLSTNKIIHLNNKNAKEYGIENENYNEIIEDNENNIWLGGIDLAKYDPNKRKFGLLAKDFPNDFNLGFSFVWGTFVDSKGHAWLGEYVPYKGIMEIDRSKNIQKRYLEDPSISYIRLWNFCEDAKGNIYAFSSSPNGIILYKKANGASSFVKLGFLKDKIKLSGNGLLISYINNKNELIFVGESPVILSNSNGDTSFKPITLPPNLKKGILMVKRKSSDELYVLNEEGIFILNESNNTAKPLTTNILFKRSDIYKGMEIIDNKWAFLSTYGNGLIKVDFEKNTKVFLTLKDGIPSLFLYDLFIIN